MLQEHELKPAMQMIKSVGGQASQEQVGWFSVGYRIHVNYEGTYQGSFDSLQQVSNWCAAIEQQQPKVPQQQPPQAQHSQSYVGSWYNGGW